MPIGNAARPGSRYPDGVDLVIGVTNVVTLIMGAVGAVVGVFAFADAAIRRPDAYPAADKKTKTAWLAITALSGMALVLGLYPLVFPPPSLIWLAGMIGSLVYLLDVRPRLREVTGGSSSSGW